MKKLLLLASLTLCALTAEANTCTSRQAGSTDQTVVIEFIDATTGAPTSGLLFNSSGIDLEYVRMGAAAVDITEATQTAAGAHADGGFVSIGHGRYRLDLPDAAVAAGVPEVVIQGTITGYYLLPCAIALSPAVNTVSVGGTAQTARDLGASVLLSSGTGSGQINLSSGAVLLQATQTGVTIPTVTTAGTCTNLTNLPTIPTNWLTSNGINADAFTAAKFANDVTTEFQSGLATAAALLDVDNFVDDLETRLTATRAGYLDNLSAGAVATASALTTVGNNVLSVLQDTGTDGVVIAETTSNCREVIGCDSQGTLSGTHSTTTADLGTNAPANDIAGMLLSVPSRNFSRYVDSYDTGTGEVTFEPATAVTLTNGDQWYLYGTGPIVAGSGGTAPTADEIADEVETRTIAAVTTVNGLANNVITAAATANDFGTEVGTATWASTTRLLTAGTNIVLAKGTGVTGFNDLSAAQVNAEADQALTDYDGPTNAEMVARTLAAASYATASALTDVDNFVDDLETRLTATRAGYLDNLSAGAVAQASALSTAQTTLDKLDDTLEDNAGTYRFTEAALQEAPSGGGGSGEADWSADERAAIRAILGIPVSGSTPADPSSGILDTTRDLVLDLPTNSELTTALAGADDATLAAISGQNNLSQAQAQTAAAAAIAAYDPPTRAEATSDANSILAALAALNDVSVSEIANIDVDGYPLVCVLAAGLAYYGGDVETSANESTFRDPTGSEVRITGSAPTPGNRDATVTCP